MTRTVLLAAVVGAIALILLSPMWFSGLACKLITSFGLLGVLAASEVDRRMRKPRMTGWPFAISLIAAPIGVIFAMIDRPSPMQAAIFVAAIAVVCAANMLGSATKNERTSHLSDRSPTF